MKNIILIIVGDPNSINSEIIFKTLKKFKNTKTNIALIGSYDLVFAQYKKLNIKIKLRILKNINDKFIKNELNIIDVPLIFKDPFKVSIKNSSNHLIKCLNIGHKLAKLKKINGIINCPINKRLIKSEKKIGITEFFAGKCNIKNHSEVMMIHNKQFSVVPLTTHIPIKDVSRNINTKMIINKIFTLNKNFKTLFKKKPKIGILGLNPHNSEFNKNSDEVKKIIPAIKFLKSKKIHVSGPIVSDTAFINYKKYDVIVGMYHDQVLSPFKALFKFDAINITLGLDYIRVSPDHGTAVDLIGKNKANYLSLLNCIKFISFLK